MNKGLVVSRDETYFLLTRFAILDSDHRLSDEAVLAALNSLIAYSPLLHRLLPRIYQRCVNDGYFHSLKPNVQSFLKQKYDESIVSQLGHYQQLLDIIALLSKKQIPIILLKGSAYNKHYYPASCPRPSNDLDLLIRACDIEHVESLFKQHLQYAPKQQADVFGDLYELSFTPKGNTGYAVDLHKALCHPYLFNVDYADLWSQSEAHPHFNNELVRVLSPEYALLHQSIHAFTDMDFANYNLCDSYHIIQSPKFGKARFIELVTTTSALHPSYLLLTRLFELLPEYKDESLVHAIRPSDLSLKLSSYLLKKSHTHDSQHKTLTYRLRQALGHYVFTGQVFKPLQLQVLFVRSALKQFFQKQKFNQGVFS